MKQSIVVHHTASHRAVGHHALFLLLVLALLQGCGTPPVKKTLSEQTLILSSENIENLLSEARLANSPARDNLYLQAADAMIRQAQQNVTPQALSVLLEIYPDQLSQAHHALYTRWYGQWALENRQQELAQKLMDNDRIADALPSLDPSLAIALHDLRIRYFLSVEQPLRAIDEHMAVAPLLLNPEERSHHQTALWSLLQQLSPADKQQLQNASSKHLQAWLDLLEIATAQELDLDEQVTQLEFWLTQHPNHPASEALPAELQLLQNSTRERPQRITLLLPLSGSLQKAGEAVRDGFFTAYFQAMQRGYSVPEVTIVDSQSSTDFLSLYRQAANNDTQLIIGPLEKEFVMLLKKQDRVPVLTLALNDSYDESTPQSQHTDRLFLFGLNPEDEARQIASQASKQHQRALVIAPNNDWGQRINQAFISRWLQRTEAEADTHTQDVPLVLGSALFDTKQEDYSTVVQQSLGIEDSQNRFRRIKPWLTGEVEFEPRRRQDIDMIFLAARPEQARQIKPLLAFHFAGDIPVYASSSVYSGESQSEKNTDLNGIQLLISPWLLNTNPLKSSIEKQTAVPASLQNLYAMGADAWRLHTRLSLLANTPSGRLYGNTGILNIESGQRIVRQQFWAKMEKGSLQAQTSSLH